MNYVEPGYVRSGYIRVDTDTVVGVRFNGHGRVIYVDPSVTQIDVADIYSQWKAWVKVEGDDGNLKWLPAMRYSGKDPIPGGFTGSTFFTTNGWRIVYNTSTTSILGVLFSEDFNTAFWNYGLQPIYPVIVSAVVNQVTSVQNVVTGDIGEVPDAVWEHLKALTVGKFLGLK